VTDVGRTIGVVDGGREIKSLRHAGSKILGASIASRNRGNFRGVLAKEPFQFVLAADGFAGRR